MSTILDQILTTKRREVAAAMRAVSFPRVEEAAFAQARQAFYRPGGAKRARRQGATDVPDAQRRQQS